MRLVTAGFIGLAIGIPLGAGTAQRWGGDVAAFLNWMPQPLATVIAAVVAASVVAWQARKALEHIIAGQNHRAQIEADARRDQARIEAEARSDKARLDRELRDAELQNERRALAAALHGELMSLMDRVHNSNSMLRVQAFMWEAIAKQGNDLPSIEINFIPHYRVPLYEVNIGRLGLLGPAIAADVAMTFSRSLTAPPEKSDAKFPAAMAAKLARAILETNEDWTWDMVHVSKRLSHVQFGNPDPGFLSEDRARRKKEKPA